MHEASAYTEFATTYNHKNMRNLVGDVDSRAHLFSHWDEVPPYRRIEAAQKPHVFEDRSGPLDVGYKHRGETRTIDDYVERNDVAALLVCQSHPSQRADDVVRDRFLPSPGNPRSPRHVP